MKEVFKSICCLSQPELKKYTIKQLKKTHTNVCHGDGFVYAQGDFPVLLVAHLDTVHKQLPKTFIYFKHNQSLSSPQGIGGDDRCGVYMILEIVKQYHCSVLFCEDEEIGMVGAEKFIKTELAKTLEFNYIIEFDRRGSDDAVFYDCDNADFEKFITQDFYNTSYGSFSDISTLAPFFGCAAVNLSCGYYKAHTTEEYVALSEMQQSIEEACKILARTTEDDKFEYIEAVRSRWGGWFDDYGYGYGNDNELLYYLLEYQDRNGDTQWWETYAASTEEAVGTFCIEHPNIPYSNIIGIDSTNEY